MLRSYPNLEGEGLTKLERWFYKIYSLDMYEILKNKGQFKRRVLQPEGVMRSNEEGRQGSCVTVEISHLML